MAREQLEAFGGYRQAIGAGPASQAGP